MIRVGAEPGPPVEGAAMRLDGWSLHVDEDGIPLPPVSITCSMMGCILLCLRMIHLLSSAKACLLACCNKTADAHGMFLCDYPTAAAMVAATTATRPQTHGYIMLLSCNVIQDDSPDAKETIWRTISRKDAAQFVRGVKRYGLAARIDDICTDVGKGMEDLTRPQKLALWNIFIDTCRQCVAKTEAENQDAKVGHDCVDVIVYAIYPQPAFCAESPCRTTTHGQQGCLHQHSRDCQ
jgi:hypothetical protein